MTECSICCETLNQSTRKRVLCPYCRFVCCLACFRRYLMDRLNIDCMSCHHELSLQFVYHTTPRTFYNKEFRAKRVEDCFQREKSMLPQTQYAVQQELHCRELEKQIRKIQLTIDRLYGWMSMNTNQYRTRLADGTYTSPRYFKRHIQEQKAIIRQIRENITRLRHYRPTDTFSDTASSSSTTIPCPADGCLGFLSNDEYKCGLCQKVTCYMCHHILTEGHTCNEDDVMSVRAIERDTKACPTCGIRIFRTMGCSQMWCTKCNSAFNWRTGEVDTGPVHNPHYFEWLRRNGGDDEKDINCAEGDLPPWTQLHDKTRQTFVPYDKWTAPYALVSHLRAVTLRETYPPPVEDQNVDVRVRYLLKEITVYEFKRQIGIRMKRREKNGELRMVLEMMADTMADIFVGFVRFDDVDLLGELEELRNYVNEEIGLIKKRYGGKNVSAPYISQNWWLIPENKINSSNRHRHFY